MIRICRAAVLLTAAAAALYSQPAGPAHIPLPADLSGTLNGTDYRIRVPANWNGTLLIYARGYLFSPATQIVPPAYPPAAVTLDERLLSMGYAVAGSFFVKNATKEGAQQTLALTNFFKGAVGSPEHTVVWGNSMGALIAVRLLETHPGIYDGAIANCGGLGGLPRQIDSTLTFGLAFAAAFGWPSEAWGPLADLRDGLNFWNEVFPLVPTPGAETNSRWEFIRLMMKMPAPAWWGVDPLDATPGLGYQMFQATSRRSDLGEDYGGPVAQNRDAVYALTDSEKAYLTALGLDANELLAWMNAQPKIIARRSAREHLEHYDSPSGNLRRPVVTMHKIYDADLLVSHEAVYRALVEAAGSGDKLVQAYVNAPGHCSFSVEQYLSAVTAMGHWLDTGIRPDASFFPEGNGFDNSFVPPPWPH